MFFGKTLIETARFDNHARDLVHKISDNSTIIRTNRSIFSFSSDLFPVHIALYLAPLSESDRSGLFFLGGNYLLDETLGKLSEEELSRYIVSLEATDREIALSRISGEFLFIFFDDFNQSAYFARDTSGSIPLFVNYVKCELIWASSLEMLGRDILCAAELSNKWIYQYVTEKFLPFDTPYRNVKLLPPGTFAQFDKYARIMATGNLDRCYCGLTHKKLEHLETINDVLLRAVSSRMSGAKRVLLELSGGLDSSLLLALYDNVFRSQGTRESLQVTCVTYDWDDWRGDRDLDYAGKLGQRFFFKHHVLHKESRPRFASSDIGNLNSPSPYIFWMDSQQAIQSLSQSLESYNVISGFGGDQLFWSELTAPIYLADRLLCGQFRNFISEFRHWRSSKALSCYDIIVAGVLISITRMLFGLPQTDPLKVRENRLLDPKVKSFARDARYTLNNRALLPSKQAQEEAISNALTLQSTRVAYHPLNLKYSCPYLDSKVIKILRSFEIAEFVNSEETRILQRAVARKYLPSFIANRRSKAGPTRVILEEMRRSEDWILRLLLSKSAVLNDFSIVQLERLKSVVESVLAGNTQYLSTVLKLMEVEVWLRAKYGISSD